MCYSSFHLSVEGNQAITLVLVLLRFDIGLEAELLTNWFAIGFTAAINKTYASTFTSKPSFHEIS